jgi:DNA-binding NarL/FixJ family response regulator
MDAWAPTRVFVVEDQPALLRQLLKSLEAFPELTVAGTSRDGEEAVAQVTAERPDVVLLDLELPSLDGIEVTRRLKGRGVEAEVLILTSFDDEEKVYQAMQAGASGYLVKRVGPEKIRSAIQEVRAGGTVIESRIATRFWRYFQSIQAAPPPSPEENAWGLSGLELEVLQLLAKGLSNAEVGQALSLQRRTVRTHLGHIYRKLKVNTHVDAVVLAVRAGLVQT